MQKTFDVLYYKQLPGRDREFSHKYSEPWGKTEHFCPRCGKQEVWFRNDGGDYYVGEQHICTNCKCSFYLPGGVRDASGEQDEQRLAHLTANGRLEWLRHEGAEMNTEESPRSPLEGIVGRAAPDGASCEHGCAGCDDCTEYGDDGSDEQRCPGCDGDGMDPMTDYALTCPVCGGMG